MDQQTVGTESIKTKFCKHCGAKIAADATFCTACGGQVEGTSAGNAQAGATIPNIVINNINTNTNGNTNANTNTNQANAYVRKNPKNKWVALTLCLLLGFIGAHKFYEEKIGMGVLYIFTCALFGIGWFVDLIVILCRPTTYYV